MAPSTALVRGVKEHSGPELFKEWTHIPQFDRKTYVYAIQNTHTCLCGKTKLVFLINVFNNVTKIRAIVGSKCTHEFNDGIKNEFKLEKARICKERREEKKRERALAKLKDVAPYEQLQIGKHKGRSLGWVHANDNQYLHWAQRTWVVSAYNKQKLIYCLEIVCEN